jgi:hypothetical protein
MMNNEPVAWMVAEMVFDTEEVAIAIGKTYDDAIIPLYTHPVKELTDEEILKVSANKFLMSEHRLVLLFARELLRKAQEK